MLYSTIAFVLLLTSTALAHEPEAAADYYCIPEKFRVIDEFLNPEGQWVSIDDFDATYMQGDQFRHVPVITAEVSTIPCAFKGCCTVTISMRPRASDFKVFRQVFQERFFKASYEHLQKSQPKYILDAGGNVGYSALFFALLFPKAQIISVEPDRANFLVHNMNTARFANVHSVNAGLWDKQTYIVFMTAVGGEWGTVFKEVEVHEPGAVFGTTITALMERFDFPHLDFAKIDIEGAEVRVFGEAADKSWLANTRILCMELHDWMAHLYGLEKVSDVVYSTMENQPFERYAEGEHIFWTRTKDGDL